MTSVDIVIYEFKSLDNMIHAYIMMNKQNKQKYCNRPLCLLPPLQECSRGVCAYPTGWWRRLLWLICVRVCSRLWACERTRLGVWPHPGPYSGEFLFRTSVLRRVGPRLSLLSVSICWTSPLRAWCARFWCLDWNVVLFPVGWWTLGKLVWQYRSNHIP